MNSYQTTIVTDVFRTYTVFSYTCGGIQWSALGRNRAAVVGYNSEGNFFSNHPLSGLSGVGDAVSCTFNIGRRRKRQDNENDMTNNMAMPIPADDTIRRLVQQCLMFEARDKLSYLGTTHTPQTLADLLDPCPCSLQQVVEDRARYRRLEDDDRNCYVSSHPIDFLLPTLGLIKLTQMCCYVDG